jgi:hypothetical protein
MSAEPSAGAAAASNGAEAVPGGTQPTPDVQPTSSTQPAASGAQPSPSSAETTPSRAQPSPSSAESAPNDAPPPRSGGVVVMRCIGGLGAVLGYGCLAAFLILISSQLYRWFRNDEWTHFGVAEGMRLGLTRCCVNDGDTGRLAALVHWCDAPVDWLGLHKVLEILPASLALFALSILGNSIFIYCRDKGGASPCHR